MPVFDAGTLLAYTAAAAILVLIPGPGTAWIVAQSIAGGTRRGAFAGLGLETATLTHATAAALGLSAILATSAHAFETIKFAGAAYLVWLGIMAWREAPRYASAQPGEGPITLVPMPAVCTRDVYRQSILTGLLNPKVALFFCAFLPQFVRPERGMVWLQFLALGAILCVIGFGHSFALAFAIGRLRRRWRANPQVARMRQRATGALFVGLGISLAFEQRS